MTQTNNIDRSAKQTSHKMSGIIDVHSHPILDVGAQAPMKDLPHWSVEHTLSLMDQHGIAASVLSIPFAANFAEGRQACTIARQVNEKLAEIVQRHPGRFAAIASLPGRNIDGGLEEMAYALDELKLDGITTTTNVDDVYLGDERFDPWLDELHRRGATLFVHPIGVSSSPAVGLGLNPSLLEFMFDTTRMLANMVFSGRKERYSNINIIATHGGGTMPYLVKRLQTLTQVFGIGEGRQQLTPQEVKAGFASFHYDLTAATSPGHLHALADLVPISRLLMGFDNPFMPEWSFAPAIDDLERWQSFTDSDLAAISNVNAGALFPALAQRMSQTR